MGFYTTLVLAASEVPQEIGDDEVTAIVWLLIFLYFVPFIVAKIRGHHNTMAIFFVNLLLGWTLLGWLFAFIWSCTHVIRETAK